MIPHRALIARVLALGAVISIAAATLVAQQAQQPSAAELVAQGLELYQRGEYADAEALFERATQAAPTTRMRRTGMPRPGCASSPPRPTISSCS